MHVRAYWIGLLLAGVFVGTPRILNAQKKDPEKGKSDAVVARTRSAIGTLFAFDKGSARPLELYSEVHDGTRLLTPPGQRGAFDIKEGDVRVTLVGNIPEISQSPVLETSVKLMASKDHAAEIVLEQGILLIETGKDSEGGRVKVSGKEKNVGLTLYKNSAVAFELTRYLPPGTRFSKGVKTEPFIELWFLVLRGKVDVQLPTDTQTLTGPVLFHWSNRGGLQGPLALKKTPDWVTPWKISDKETLRILDAAEKVRRRSEKNPKAALEALKSKEPGERVIGVYHAIALDRPADVLGALNTDANPKVRKAATHALRVYVGEEPDRGEKLRSTLVESKFKPGQAGIFLHLLEGFNADERGQPATYDSLIRYLQHDQMAIRELAAQQLRVLVPAGKDIAFDASADADSRAKAQAEWRKLIPEGGLPKVESK